MALSLSLPLSLCGHLTLARLPAHSLTLMHRSSFCQDMLWRIVSSFVDEKTRDKIQFLSGQELPQMLDVLGEDEMPEDFLGVPIHQMVKDIQKEAASRVFTMDEAT